MKLIFFVINEGVDYIACGSHKEILQRGHEWNIHYLVPIGGGSHHFALICLKAFVLPEQAVFSVSGFIW